MLRSDPESPPRSPYLDDISSPRHLFQVPQINDDILDLYDFSKFTPKNDLKIFMSNESTNLMLQYQNARISPSSSFPGQNSSSVLDYSPSAHDDSGGIVKIFFPENPRIHIGDIFPSFNRDNSSPDNDHQNRDNQIDMLKVGESPKSSSEEAKTFKAVNFTILIPSTDSTAPSSDFPHSNTLLNKRWFEDIPLEDYEPHTKKIKKKAVFEIIKTVRNVIKQDGNNEERKEISATHTEESKVDHTSRGAKKARRPAEVAMSEEEPRKKSNPKKETQTVSRNWPIAVLKDGLDLIEAYQDGYQDGGRLEQSLNSIFKGYRTGALKKMINIVRNAINGSRNDYSEVKRVLSESVCGFKTAQKDVAKAILEFYDEKFDDWEFVRRCREDNAEEVIQEEKDAVRANFERIKDGLPLKRGPRGPRRPKRPKGPRKPNSK